VLHVDGGAKETPDEKKAEDKKVPDEKKDDPKEVRLVPLNSSDEEYKRAVQMFASGIASGGMLATVSAVYRVISRPLQTAYEACKARMDKEGRQICGMEVGGNEKLLFHGTTRAAVGGIVREGFDMKRAGEAHGTALGRGAYFATDACTSMGYVKRDAHGNNCMLVCKVLVGAPKRDAVHVPGVYVVQKSQQILPVYVLHLKPTTHTRLGNLPPFQPEDDE
jgi:hypothetical protein